MFPTNQRKVKSFLSNLLPNQREVIAIFPWRLKWPNSGGILFNLVMWFPVIVFAFKFLQFIGSFIWVLWKKHYGGLIVHLKFVMPSVFMYDISNLSLSLRKNACFRLPKYLTINQILNSQPLHCNGWHQLCKKNDNSLIKVRAHWLSKIDWVDWIQIKANMQNK